MKKQELFDRVARHLLTQMKQSMVLDANDPRSRCRYRGPNGLKCAIGCLIPDEKYSEELEGLAVPDPEFSAELSPQTEKLLKVAGLTKKQCGLASILQALHDNIDPADWRDELTKIAQSFELKTAAIEGVT